MWLPGVLVAAAAALLSWALHSLIPAAPLLTIAVVLGIIAGQLPALRRPLAGTLAPGLSVAGQRFMRLGIVLLGLKLSLGDIAGLGWVTIATTVVIVLVTFAGTLGLGRLFGLPGHQPLLIASGFSICGASAIGAMSGVVKAKDEDAATSIALVTLCGTLAIAVLPALWHPLGLSPAEFGHWVGAGVHDVGQVVATAQVAGPAALAIAVVVKLTRVLMLAPIVAVASVVERRRPTPTGDSPAKTPLMPLFVVGFIATVVLASVVPLPTPVLEAADAVQTALLAMALFGLGSAVRLLALVRTGWRALVVGLLSWVLVAALAYGAVHLG
ncbi:membrane protein [Cryobacterium roopkundense]|uniref:Membrane protein n=1 Tax=Cryobacterium roopkundense TaxID=1001240 RepID=A0A099J5S9_9MICO|nr:putative sulfate exporter family transporter [Cryobacterium roopkundense]KGJ72813.1 membrane protein [Cryobacterium roopkundense]MBB5640055.1 putative integral membrane protein (TIGR00698 family) [Cryobacterium roopkundense]